MQGQRFFRPVEVLHRDVSMQEQWRFSSSGILHIFAPVLLHAASVLHLLFNHHSSVVLLWCYRMPFSCAGCDPFGFLASPKLTPCSDTSSWYRFMASSRLLPCSCRSGPGRVIWGIVREFFWIKNLDVRVFAENSQIGVCRVAVRVAFQQKGKFSQQANHPWSNRQPRSPQHGITAPFAARNPVLGWPVRIG